MALKVKTRFLVISVTLIPALAGWLAPGVLAQDMLTLRAGRMLDVQMVDDGQSGSVNPGDEVTFRLLDDIMVHGNVALPKGTTGVLTIKASGKNGRFGKGGFVEYGGGVIHLDPLEIPVEYSGINPSKGKSRFTTGLLYLIVGVFFVKGEEGGLIQGQDFSVKITETLQVPVGH